MMMQFEKISDGMRSRVPSVRPAGVCPPPAGPRFSWAEALKETLIDAALVLVGAALLGAWVVVLLIIPLLIAF
jgi:hypothetical protein